MHNIFMKSDKNFALEKSKNVELSDSLKLAQQTNSAIRDLSIAKLGKEKVAKIWVTYI